jgi:transitional endoplasmic reticulum ATPase
MDETIQQLREALLISPNNIPLRSHLADILLKNNDLQEATEHYAEILKNDSANVKALTGLSEIYYRQKKNSASIILFEQLQEINALTFDQKIKFVRVLLKENSLEEAKDIYQNILAEQPDFRDDEIDKMLRFTNEGAFSDDDFFDEDIAADSKYFLEKPGVTFSDVGGMEKLKKEISIKIIQPFKNPGLYKAFNKKAGGGILMYGPPGCGKTFIAKATAGEIDAKFISIGLHDILDMWIGSSEKNLHEVFQIARKNTPCVFFIDEVDALGASRNDMKHSSMRQIINQFLLELDGVKESNEGILILSATNAPWSVDSAFRRPGRFDRVIFVSPPDEKSREEIFISNLQNVPVENIDTAQLAKLTSQYSGADIKAVIDIATEDKLEASLAKGSLQPISQKDFAIAIRQHKPTTTEWFNTAKNYALYANEAGFYDEILEYMKIKK